MMLQKAAGGSDIANTGLSNIFGALQSYGTSKMYGDIYGGEDYRKNLTLKNQMRTQRQQMRTPRPKTQGIS